MCINRGSDRQFSRTLIRRDQVVGPFAAFSTHTGRCNMLRMFRVLPCTRTWLTAAADAACSHRYISQTPLAGPPGRPSVWMQILQRASEDQEKLREIVRDMKIHCEQVHCAPPLEVFNELLRLCNYWHDGESMHKLLALMGSRNMQVDKYTYMHINEGFSYFPRAFSDPGPAVRSSPSPSSSGRHVQTSMPPHQLHQQTPVQHHHGSTRHQVPQSSTAGAHVQVAGRQQAGSSSALPTSQAGSPAANPAAAGGQGLQPRSLQTAQQQQQQQQERQPSTGGT